MAQRILVPIDFSPGCAPVLAWAVALAGPLRAQLDVLHVVPHPHQLDPFFRPGLTPPRTVAAIRERAERRLASMLRGTTVRAPLRVVEGEPAAAILDQIERRSPDLVIVGTRARGGIARTFLGSVAEKVIRHSPVPVLTVRYRTSTGAS